MIVKPSSMRRRVGWCVALAFAGAGASDLGAQDLEPRAFSPAPVSVNFAAVGYGYSFGNVLLDPSIPLEDGTGKVHSLIAAYVRTFSFLGMSAKADAIVPVAIGDWEGRLAGQDTSRSASGMGDPTVRLSVNFVGAPALEMPRFMTYRQGTVVGASLRISMPLGQYDNTKLINLGTNRWTFAPRIGVSRRAGHWNLEASLRPGFTRTTRTSLAVGWSRIRCSPSREASHTCSNEAPGSPWMAAGARAVARASTGIRVGPGRRTHVSGRRSPIP